MADNLEAKLGLNTDDFDKSLSQMGGKLSSAMKEWAGIAAVAGAAFKIFTDYAKSTGAGMDVMAVAGRVWRQELTNIASGIDLLNIPSLIAAGKAQSELNRVMEEDIYGSIEVSKLTQKISIARFKAAEAGDNEKEKLIQLNEALRLHNERNALLIRQAEDQYNAQSKLFKQGGVTLEQEKNLAKIITELNLLNGEDLEARRLQIEITNIQDKNRRKYGDYLKAITKDLQDEADAARETADELVRLKKENDKLSPTGMIGAASRYAAGGINRYSLPAKLDTSKLAEMPQYEYNTKNIDKVTESLTDQQKELVGLADQFASLFSNVDQGFKGMIDGMIKSLERLIAQLIARAVILAILKLITKNSGGGETGGGGGWGNMFSGGLFNIFKSGGGGGVSDTGLKVQSGGGNGSNFEFRIKGNDLVTVLQRNS